MKLQQYLQLHKKRIHLNNMRYSNKIKAWELGVIVSLFMGMFLIATCTLTYSSRLRITFGINKAKIDTIVKTNSIKINIDTLKTKPNVNK